MVFGKVKSFLVTLAQVAAFVAVTLVSLFVFKRKVEEKAETTVKQELQLEDMRHALKIKEDTENALRKESLLHADSSRDVLIDELHKAGKLRD